MDFAFSPEHEQLHETLRRHTEEEMRPHLSETDDSEGFHGTSSNAGARLA